MIETSRHFKYIRYEKGYKDHIVHHRHRPAMFDDTESNS